MISLFTVANIMFIFGSLPNIIEVCREKSKIKGYSLYGALITLIALILTNIGVYVHAHQLIPIFFAIPTIIYWLLVTVYMTIKKYGEMKR